MTKNKLNRIDKLISNLFNEFSGVPNFDLTQTDKEGNKLFNLIVAKFSDIQDFKTIYQKYFIPATNKAIADTKMEIRNSVFAKRLKITEAQLKENYYDTIRLGYVGLFHKIENYIKDLLLETNLIFNEGEDSLEKYIESNNDYKIRNWYSDKTLHKINWICNCVKHYDGYPKKEPKYDDLSHLPEDEKIKIDHHEFYNDIDYIVNNFYLFKLGQILTLCRYKNVAQNMHHDFISDDLKERFIELENKAKQLMKN